MYKNYLSYSPFEKQAIDLLNRFLPVPILVISLILAYYGKHSVQIIILSISFIVYNLFIKTIKERCPDHAALIEISRNTLNGFTCAFFSYLVGNDFQGYLFCIPLLFAIPFTFKFIPSIIMITYTLLCSMFGYVYASGFVFLSHDLAFLLGMIVYSYLTILGVFVLRNHFIKMDKMNEELKNEILKRKEAEETLKNAWEQLKSAQTELVNNAHKAGMADIAAETLHNIGNILSSVKTSSHIIDIEMKSKALKGLRNANELLSQNINDLDAFIADNPKGKKLMQYYLVLGKMFDEERENISIHTQRLETKVDTIAEVLAAQQSYAGSASMSDHCSIPEIVEDALIMQHGNLEKYNIIIEKNFSNIPKIFVQKTKLIHILVNLIKNAKESMIEASSEENRLSLENKISFEVFSRKEKAYIRVIDTGIGIMPENLKKIFNHGFTTKKEGHGFGLHSSANYMSEMNGTIKAESDGKGKGTTFELEFVI